MTIVNIAAYKFIELVPTELVNLQQTLKTQAQQNQLKGTILLSAEGMNLTLAGERKNITIFQDFLRENTHFSDLTYKESLSQELPFSKLLVRIKKEIISMGCDAVQATKERADYISPEKFKAWYEQGQDMIVLDTRNNYEFELGTFANAIHMDLKTFREFPEAVDKLPADMKEKPVITFCTGGIRCEKAAILLRKKGFREVYQLEGGILNYFSQCGGHYFNGECFVFDDRVAVDSKLQPTTTRLCKNCGNPLTIKQTDYDCRCQLFKLHTVNG